MLTGGTCGDDPSWVDQHRMMVDRRSHRYAPDVIACGVGEARAQTILSLATRPELAYLADDGDLAGAVDQFCRFVQRLVIGFGQAVVDGDRTTFLPGPEGFRLAGELLPQPEGAHVDA
jgi:hypothetical protein